jgi:hypothetical protein
LVYLSPGNAAGPLAETAEISRMLNALRIKVEQGISGKTKVGVDRPQSIVKAAVNLFRLLTIDSQLLTINYRLFFPCSKKS